MEKKWATQVLEENLSEFVYNLSVGDLLKYVHHPEAITKKINEFGYINKNNLCTKNVISKLKRQVTNWEKYNCNICCR